MSRERFLRLPLRIAAATALVSLVAPSAGAQSEGAFVPVTDAMLEEPDAGDWLHWRRTQNGWAYSPLDQIDRENVGDLTMAWSRGLQPGSQQGTPLVYDGVMYFPNPSSVTQAIDAATGDLLWEYRRPIPKDIATYVGGLETVNRSLAIYGGLIIDTANDGYVYALDAVTGELVWETRIVDYEVDPARHSTGPLVAAGRVISGRSCRPHRGPEACVIVAHDATTGEELWRRPLIPQPGEPGNETWGDLAVEDRHHVGSWMAPSYDPELELLILGTSVTSPAPKFLLGGHEKRHLYHNSTLALEVDTGEIRWYYQHLNDHWDLDHPFERLLVDTAVAPDAEAVPWRNPRIQPGEMRKVVTGVPGKTGLVYTLDRETGEFLWARPTVPQNVIERIDGATGVVVENPGSRVHRTGAGERADLSVAPWRQGLGGRGLQSADEHDVLPAPELVLPDDDTRGSWGHALRAGERDPACAWEGTARHGLRDLGGDRRNALAPRAAGGDDVARRDRWRSRVRRRHRRPLLGSGPGDRRGAVGDQPRLLGDRFSGQLRGGRPAVRGGWHRRRGRHDLDLPETDGGASVRVPTTRCSCSRCPKRTERPKDGERRC